MLKEAASGKHRRNASATGAPSPEVGRAAMEPVLAPVGEALVMIPFLLAWLSELAMLVIMLSAVL